MASYHSLLNRLFHLYASHEMKLDLEIPRRLDAFLEFPHRAYPCVHVAGTNGKGSVVTKIAKALELSGLVVGRYTSPHLTNFRERITVQGQWIPEAAVINGMKKLFDFIDQEKISATFFELTTLLALDYFRAAQVDVAVIETGLGGRLDCTNIIDPLLTVITSITREHAHILGDSLDSIAIEKAGILKPSVPLVLGRRAYLTPILKRAEEMGCPYSVATQAGRFYDSENREIAKAALRRLTAHFSLPPESIEDALNFRPACRFEVHGETIFDVAHNPDGFDHLIEALDHFYPTRELFVLIGMSKDKEYSSCLTKISRRAKKIFLVQAKGQRSASLEELATVLRDQKYSTFVKGQDVSTAAKIAAVEATEHQALLLICGSFYIMEEARCALLHSQPPTDLYDKAGEKYSFAAVDSTLSKPE